MNQRHKKIVSVLLRACVAAVLMFAVFRRVGFRTALSVLGGVQMGYILAALVFYFLMYLVKSLRWRFLLISQGMPVGLWRGLSIYLFSSLFGAFTPGRIGEAIRVLGPAREKGLYAESTACAAVDKAFDIALLVVLLASASACSLLSRYESLVLLAGGLAGMGALAGALLLVRYLGAGNVALPGCLLRLLPKAWHEPLHEQPGRLLRAVVDCVRRVWVVGGLCTGTFWLLHVVCHLLILKSLGGSMDFGYLVLCLVLSSIVEFLPVTICGLGTREYLLIYLFGRVRLPEALAVAFGLMNLVFTYAVTAAFVLMAWCLRDGKQG